MIHDTESETPNSVTVSEITSRHIRRLASSASDFLGKQVNAAVITVPTDFSDEQKEALSNASKNAGVEVLQYISEPVAAVLAYDARPESKVEDKLIVVADLGGTRSDVAVIASRGGMYSILSTCHDYELGGIQLDQVLIDHFAKEFIKKHKTDPRENSRSLAKFKLEAEATKKALSLGANASLSIESLAEGIDFSSTINRTRYELLANKVFGGFTRLIQAAIQKADLDVLDINEVCDLKLHPFLVVPPSDFIIAFQVILSGGTSHTPRIASLLASLFPPATTILAPSTFPSALSPSSLAARGAAIQASLIQEFEVDDITQSTHPMVTVTPHLSQAVGVLVVSGDIGRGVFVPLLEKETAVPVRRAGVFATPKEGGDVLIKVCEAERDIRVSKSKPKAATANGVLNKTAGDSDEDDSDEDEEQEIREKIWKVGTVLAEASVRAVSKGAKVEVTVNVGADLAVVVTAREVGGKGGVRGSLEKAVRENGSAG